MYVSLNISGNNIRILSLKGRQVKKWASLDLADGLVRDGLVLQPKAVGEAVNSLFKSTGMPRDRVIISIAGLSFTYRFLTLPRMKPHLLEEAILRAARKEISLPLDELYLSWQQLPGKGDELSFFVLGVPRNLVDAAVDTLKTAGVEPYFMDLRPLALARTAERSDAIIVNLEPDCFDIVFITGGVPMVIHTLTPRGEGATLEDNIRRLADELSKTAAFYQSNHPDVQLSPATPLLLTGELAADSPASALLQSEIEYPIETLVPPVELPEGLPVALYTASIGLALKKTPRKPVAKGDTARFTDLNVNILEGKYRKPKAKPVPIGYVLLGVFLALFVILLYPLYQARAQVKTDNAALETNLNDIWRQLNLATIINEEDTATEGIILEIAANAEAVKNANLSILGSRGDFTTDLQMATSVIPPRTFFTAIDIGKFEISMQGEADNAFTVIDYAAALESLGRFQGVRITSLDEALSSISVEEDAAIPTPKSIITFEIIIQKNTLDSTK